MQNPRIETKVGLFVLVTLVLLLMLGDLTAKEIEDRGAPAHLLAEWLKDLQGAGRILEIAIGSEGGPRP